MKKIIKKPLFIFLLALGLIFPFFYAHAITDTLARLFSNYLIANLIRFILWSSRQSVNIASVVLNWVLSENFINFPYTDPAGNPIIAAGWGLMRDLVNMFFIIALAFIGLATALRIKQYEIQKTLPRLIFIILICNFSPVLCGIVVDFSNILTYFFIGQLSGLEFLRSRMVAESLIIQNLVKGWFDWQAVFSSVIQGLIMAGANNFTALILFLFALIFVVRYVAIWIAVILSPLAFFASIFPQLPIIGGFWRTWLNQFLQWCFVGVTAAFFLYLGNNILVTAPAIIGTEAPTGDILHTPYPWQEFLGNITPFLIAVLFLYFGFSSAVSIGATGAQVAIGVARKTGKKTKALMGKTKTAALKKGKSFVREKAPPEVRRAFRELATIRRPNWLEVSPDEKKKGVKGWAGRAAKWAGRASTDWIWQGISRVGETALPRAELEDIEKAKAELKDLRSPEDYAIALNRTKSRDERIAILQKAREEGVDLYAQLKKDIGEKAAKDRITEIGMEAFDVGAEAAIPLLRAYPTLAAEMASFATDREKRKAKISEEQIIKWAKENKERLGLGVDRGQLIDWVWNNRRGLGLEGLSKDEVEDKVKDNFEDYADKWITAKVKGDLGGYVAKKLTAGLGPKDIEKTNEDFIDKEAIHAFWGGREIATAGRTFGRSFVDEFTKAVEKRGADWYLQRGNLAIPYFLTGTPAQDLGYRPPEGMDKPELKEKIRLVRMTNEQLGEKFNVIQNRLSRLRELPPEEIIKHEEEIAKLEQKSAQFLQEHQRRGLTPPPPPPPPPPPSQPSPIVTPPARGRRLTEKELKERRKIIEEASKKPTAPQRYIMLRKELTRLFKQEELTPEEIKEMQRLANEAKKLESQYPGLEKKAPRTTASLSDIQDRLSIIRMLKTKKK